MEIRAFRTAFAMIASTAALVGGASSAMAGKPERPRLVVLVVADQMRDDYLDRWGPRLPGGLGRLYREGRRFTQASLDQAPTNSLPGHLSAASGAYPNRHGLVDNQWVETIDGRPRLVVGFQDDCPIVASNAAARVDGTTVGPKRFEAPTIVEWALAADPNARFASIGSGEGVSALHAGKARGLVLWFNPAAAGYVTTRCYADRLPAWVDSFNASLASRFMSRDWLAEAAPWMVTGKVDKAAYENGGVDNVFPHRRPTDTAALLEWYEFSPFDDEATLALASEAVQRMELGKDGVTDVLTIGLSTLDHVGHRFGPGSVEQADTLFRLDKRLGQFLALLDKEVGRGRWVLGLTADHGAPDAPEARTDGARRISREDADRAITALVGAAGAHQERSAQIAAIREAARQFPFIERIVSEEEVAVATAGKSDDPLLRLYANSFRPGRTSAHPFYANAAERRLGEFGVIAITPPGWVVDWATSIHGSPHDYDRNVEFIVFGRGVTPGVCSRPVRHIDLAPTLAALAGLAPTQAVDGQIRAVDRC